MKAVPLLQDYLIDSAERLPDKVALVCRGRRLTYAELEAQSNAFANALERRGIARGDRVLVFAENSAEAVIAFWGVLKANAVISMLSPLTRTDKLRYLLSDCQASALVADALLEPVFIEAAAQTVSLKSVFVIGELREKPELYNLPGLTLLENAIREEAPDQKPRRQCIDVDLAALIYTSGSTGEPKGVMLTHRNMLTAATSITAYLENVEDDVILSVLPLSFNYGLYQMIMAFRVGARLVLERSFAFPVEVLQRIAEEHITGFPGVPTVFAMLKELDVRKEFDLSSIRYVTNTAAALSAKHIELLKDIFPKARIYSMYGLTECKRCTYLPPEDLARKPGSVGIAIPNTELWIVDENDRKLGPNQVGQLVIRGATVMRGYWGKPEQTAEKLRPGLLPGEYVLYTGDYCKLDEDGYLYFVSRMDDVIKSRGEKVPPKEVENVLVNIPGVKEAAVIGVPDDVLGQAVKAFIVPESDAKLDEHQIQRECQRRLESFMVPKYFVIVPDLPKTTSGKISKTALS